MKAKCLLRDWKLLIKIPVAAYLFWLLLPVTFHFLKSIWVVFIVSVTNIGTIEGITELDANVILALYAIVLLFPLFGLWNFFLWLDARELWKKLLSPIPLLLPQLLALIVVIGVFWIDKQVSYFHFFRAFEFVTGKLQ